MNTSSLPVSGYDARSMCHVVIQVDASQAEEIHAALNRVGLRCSRLHGDCLKVPFHSDGLQVERVLKGAGIRLFSGPSVVEGSGLETA